MCKFKSGIILKNKSIICEGENDSHSDLLEKLGIEDNYLNSSKTFVRAELIPKDGEWWTDSKDWKFVVDQDIVPDWFEIDREKYEKEFREAVSKWVSEHIKIGEEIEELNEGYFLLKDCKVKILKGNIIIGKMIESVVDKMSGNSKIEMMCGNSTVKYMYENSTIEEMHNDSTIEEMHNDSTITEMYINSTVKYMYDNSTVKYMYGDSTVKYMYSDSTIAEMYGDSTVKYMYDNSIIEEMYNDSIVKYMYDNSTVKHMHDDSLARNYTTNELLASKEFNFKITQL